MHIPQGTDRKSEFWEQSEDSDPLGVTKTAGTTHNWNATIDGCRLSCSKLNHPDFKSSDSNQQTLGLHGK